MLVGEKDYKVIKESAGDLINSIPNSRSYIVPKLGHVWNLQSPEFFNQVLCDWITGNSLPSHLRELIL